MTPPLTFVAAVFEPDLPLLRLQHARSPASITYASAMARIAGRLSCLGRR